MKSIISAIKNNKHFRYFYIENSEYTKRIVGIFFILILFIGYVNNFFVEKNISKKHIVVCGKVYAIHPQGGNRVATYEYSVKGKIYRAGEQFCTYETRQNFEKGDSNVIVVVQSDDYSNTRIISTSDDVLKYHIVSLDTVGLRCEWPINLEVGP